MAAKKEAAKTLKITLIKSTIGQVPKNRATVEAMGLRKLHQTVELPDNASTRGQIQRVRHMVKVEEA
ncbi:MAG: 50S ribosomal protein L30 [Lachnospiraceae bacterium]|nr:50S ribosomal protein L30 [Lachnospiraceae bacterium]